MKTYPASLKEADLNISSNEVSTAEVSTADNDVRYVPTETTHFEVYPTSPDTNG